MRGLGREAKGLRGAWVLQQGPGLEAVRATRALTMKRRLAVRWGRGLARWHGQRLEWGMRRGQPLWVQRGRLLDMSMGSRSRRGLWLARGLGGRGRALRRACGGRGRGP